MGILGFGLSLFSFGPELVSTSGEAPGPNSAPGLAAKCGPSRTYLGPTWGGTWTCTSPCPKYVCNVDVDVDVYVDVYVDVDVYADVDVEVDVEVYPTC